MSLVGLLVLLVVFCLFLWAARAIMGAFGIGDPISTIVYVVIVLAGVLWLIQTLGLMGGPAITLR
jgi:heme/copper-type cytochrome/quinol oxidase subunit 4